MELRHLMQLFRSKLVPTVVVSFLVAVVVYTWVSYLPPKFVATLDLYIAKTPEVTKSGEYGFDGYYAQQVAEAYTDTVIGLLESPDTLAQALSDIDLSGMVNLSKYKNSVKVQRTAPQLISLSVTLTNEDTAIKLTKAIAATVQARSQTLSQRKEQAIAVELVNTDPLIDQDQLSPTVAGLAGFMIGLGLCISWIFFKEYLRET